MANKNIGTVNYLGVIIPSMNGVSIHDSGEWNAVQCAKRARIMAKTITAMEDSRAWNTSFEDQAVLAKARAVLHNIATRRNE